MFRASGMWGKCSKCCVFYLYGNSSSPPLQAQVITHNQSPVLMSEGFASCRGWCWFTACSRKRLGPCQPWAALSKGFCILDCFILILNYWKLRQARLSCLYCAVDGLRCELPLWKAGVSGGDDGCLCRVLANSPQPWTWKAGWEEPAHAHILFFDIK